MRAADLRFTGRGGGRLPQRLNGPGPRAGGPRSTRRPHRGMGRRPPAGGALSAQTATDRTSFIAGFAGRTDTSWTTSSTRSSSQQPDDVRGFLLDTSILEQLTGPLCDAVSPPVDGSGSSGKAMLETLDRENLFLVPLDGHRRWYRYHHLFGDVLRAHLLQERPDDLSDLHRRASGWYADAGNTEAAVRHALGAGDTARAADLVELSFRALGRDRREDLTRRWAHELPADLVGDRPVLAVALIGGLMASNELEDVGRRLDHVETLLVKPRTDVVVVDPDELRRMPAAVQMYRAALALVGGDATSAVAIAEQAIGAAVDDDHLVAGASAALSGLASWSLGDIVSAHASYTTAVPAMERAGHLADMLGCSIALADMDLGLGHLGRAERTLTSALELAGHTPRRARRSCGAPRTCSSDWAGCPGTATISTGPPTTCAAPTTWARRRHCRRTPIGGDVGLARLRAAEGDLSTALDLLDEAERVYVADYFPEVEPIHAIRARVLVGARRPRRRAGMGASAPGCPGRLVVLPARARAHHPGSTPARRARHDRLAGDAAGRRPAPRPTGVRGLVPVGAPVP